MYFPRNNLLSVLSLLSLECCPCSTRTDLFLAVLIVCAVEIVDANAMKRFFPSLFKKPEYGPLPFYHFYTNQLRSSPDNALLRDMHDWQGDYETLESGHGFIQWLFPTRSESAL